MIARAPRLSRLSALVLSAALLFAQSNEWYQNPDHIFTNRWEGLVGEDQGSPDWEVRSFVANVEPYPMNKNVDLNLTYFSPDSSKAFIKASSINRNPSYRMVPRPNALKPDGTWISFKGWPTKDVLLPRNITSGNLGALIRLGADSEANHRLAPAIIYYSAMPKSLTIYRLDFFTALPIKSSSFTVLGEKNYSHSYPLRAANARSILPLEFNAAEIPDGPTKVILNLVYTDSTKSHLEWQFYSKALP